MQSITLGLGQSPKVLGARQRKKIGRPLRSALIYAFFICTKLYAPSAI